MSGASSSVPRSPAAPALAGRRVEVRWPAMLTNGGRGARAFELVIAVHVLDPGHALLEAWVVAPDGIRTIASRQPVVARVEEAGLVHLDALHRDRRVLALSFLPGDPPRLVYAQTPLLEDAGFGPGAHDPPRVEIRVPESDVVSA